MFSILNNNNIREINTSPPSLDTSWLCIFLLSEDGFSTISLPFFKFNLIKNKMNVEVINIKRYVIKK